MYSQICSYKALISRNISLTIDRRFDISEKIFALLNIFIIIVNTMISLQSILLLCLSNKAFSFQGCDKFSNVLFPELKTYKNKFDSTFSI